MHMTITSRHSPSLLHMTFAVLLLGSIPSILFSCGPKDDGVHRSENGVLLPPGERFKDEDRRRR